MTDTMKQATNPQNTKFLIDGFPIEMDQAITFEESVCPGKLVLFFDCPEMVLEKRLLKRGEISGRSDDNLESIKKRFRTFIEASMPVVEYFGRDGRGVRIEADRASDLVYANVKRELEERLGPLHRAGVKEKANNKNFWILADFRGKILRIVVDFVDF
ncbi:hypothetical protein B7463_g1576, partial [Scytalidium lignicola]